MWTTLDAGVTILSVSRHSMNIAWCWFCHSQNKRNRTQTDHAFQTKKVTAASIVSWRLPVITLSLKLLYRKRRKFIYLFLQLKFCMLTVYLLTGNDVHYNTLQDVNMKLLFSKPPKGENPFSPLFSLLLFTICSISLTGHCLF